VIAGIVLLLARPERPNPYEGCQVWRASMVEGVVSS
jgi:hypothetical protein